MNSFKDSHGDEWVLTIDYGVIRRVRDVCCVDLLKIFEADLTTLLYVDLIKLIDVVAAVLKPALDAKSLAVEKFADRLTGNATEEAYTALFRAIADFFPKARREMILQATEALLTEAGKLPEQAREAIAAERSKQAAKSKSTSSDAPEPVESIPAALPYESST